MKKMGYRMSFFSKRSRCVTFIISALFSLHFLSCSDDNPASIYTPSIDTYLEIINLAKAEAQKTRELSFIHPVKIGILSREQYKSYNGTQSTDESSLIIKEFKQIGFVPDTLSNMNYIENNSDNFAAAFYRPGTDSLYIINADQYDTETLFKILVHEFTHALAEQHFNPFTNYVYSGTFQSTLNSDYYISQLSIAEGDASVNETYTYFSYISPSTAFKNTESYINNYSEYFYDNLTTFSIPRYIEIQGYAPYLLGEKFVWDHFTSGGWSNVNRLYHASRVSSMSEIITGLPISPYTFDFSDIMPSLLKNTTKLKFADDDTYGPVMLMALLNETVDTTHCRKAFGWQGDRLAYTLSDNQTYGSFVWAMKFATDTDASYISGKLDTFYMSRNLGKTASVRTVDSIGIQFTSSAAATSVRRNGSFVFVMENVTDKAEILASLETPAAIAKKSADTATYSTVSFQNKRKVIDNLFGRK